MSDQYRTASAPYHGPTFFSVEETRTTHPSIQGDHVHHVVRHPGGAAVVAVDGSDVLCVMQYRPAVRQLLVELPAGRIEPGETPAETAERELLEETGYVADHIQALFNFYNAPCFCDGVTHLFMATGLRRAPGLVETGIPLTVQRIALHDVRPFIQQGRITDAKTIIGLLTAMETMRRPL